MEREYIGIDLHKAFFQVCVLTAVGERVWEGRLPHTDAGIAQLANRLRRPTRIAVEATGPTWSFVDRLQPTGAEIWVVDPRKTKLKAGFAAKTDRLDARRLADALRRDSVVSIYVPPPAIRELREVCRSRHQLVRLRTRTVQMIRALLLRQAVAEASVTRLYTPRGIAWLRQVALPPVAALTLRRLTDILERLQSEAVDAERALVARAREDAIAGALDQMVGIGPVLGLTLRAEIGDITRFASGPKLASFAGVVSRVERSANRGYAGRITRQGSPWIRWALVEAARHAMKRRDGVGRWARRLAVRKGMNKARVALARRLCDELVAQWPRA